MTRISLFLPVPLVLFISLLQGPATPGAASAGSILDEACVTCHEDVTPGAVGDWRSSRHFVEEITCSDCHGDGHTTADDVLEVELPTPETCETCHSERVEQYSAGKHALAWTAMKAMPTIHWQPAVLTEGLKGCGGCHKIGLKSDEEIVDLKLEGHRYGVASCDACHTRHTFSVEEARQPEACRTCHMGFDHPQYEMYSSSKHGVRHGLKRDGVLPETAAAPTCQTCHMPDGDHAVMTPWGFLAVRLPMPDDAQWAADRTTILKALGVLSPDGEPTARLQAVRDAKVARLDYGSWFDLREKMVGVCTDCHAETYARAELAKGDDSIREADRMMAQAIGIVAGLYEDGTIPKPESWAYPYPDLLAFHDASTVVEQRLFVMFLKHRMRAFQGAFHMNPDYALWYGWSEMVMDLTEIRELADGMRH